MTISNPSQFGVDFKIMCISKLIIDAITLAGNQCAFDANLSNAKIPQGKFNYFLSMVNDSGRGFAGSGGILIDMIYELFEEVVNFLGHAKKNKINKMLFMLAAIGIVVIAFTVNDKLSQLINNTNSRLINNAVIKGALGAAFIFAFVVAIVLFGTAIDAILTETDKKDTTHKIKKKLALLASLLVISLSALVLESYLRIYNNINNPLILFSLTAISILFGISTGCQSIIKNLFSPGMKKIFKDYNNCFKDRTPPKKESESDKKKRIWKLLGYFTLLFTLTVTLTGISHFIELQGINFLINHLGLFGAGIVNDIIYSTIFIFAVLIGIQASASLFEIAKTYLFDNPRNFNDIKDPKYLRFAKNLRLFAYISLSIVMFSVAAFPLLGIVAHFDDNINLGVIEKIFTKSFTPLIILICTLISTIILGYLAKLHIETNQINSHLESHKSEEATPLLSSQDSPVLP